MNIFKRFVSEVDTSWQQPSVQTGYGEIELKSVCHCRLTQLTGKLNSSFVIHWKLNCGLFMLQS